MANFYDYYVSNDSEGKDRQEKAFKRNFKTRDNPVLSSSEGKDRQKKTVQRDFKTRDNPVLNSTQGKNFHTNGKIGNYHALNDPEEMEGRKKTFLGDCMARDWDKHPDVYCKSPEDGRSVRLQRDGKETAGWRYNEEDRGGKADEFRGGSEGGGNGRMKGGGWEDKAVDDCSHIYSDGTSVNSLFDTRQDKIAAMNMIATLAYSYNVKILVQQVMTTHIHLIVSGAAWDRERFARELRRRLIIWAEDKRHSANGVIMVGNDEIRTERELMNKFMYVYRNAIAAGYPGMPWEYVGGPGNIFFTRVLS